MEIYEKVFDEVLLVVFFIVKELVKCFFENEEIVVMVIDFDCKLVVIKDFVCIEGDKVIW